MVHYTSVRRDKNDPPHRAPYVMRDEQRDATDALQSVLVYDLGYGGDITALSYDQTNSQVTMEVSTRVLSKTDITTIRGSVEEMIPFVELARAWDVAMKRVSVEKLYYELPQIVKDKTCWLVWSFGWFKGRKILPLIAAQLLGLPEAALNWIERVHPNTKEIFSVYELMQEGEDVSVLFT